MKLWCLLLVLFLNCVAYSQSALQSREEGAQLPIVRGLVKKQSSDGKTTYPVAQVRVTLTPAGADAQTTGADAVTGVDGMFYFYKIPPGSYVLRVNSLESPWVGNIEVKATASYNDIPEIILASARSFPTATPQPSPGDWAYYGQRDPQNITWSGKYFKKETGDPDGIPQIGDVVIAQGNVYVRKGPAYRNGNDYYNEEETGKIVKKGDRVKVLERRGPFPGDPQDLTYPWLYFRFQSLGQ
jgi:hypothetical protein